MERYAVHVLPQDQIDLDTLASPKKISHVSENSWEKLYFPPKSIMSRQNI
jgi:hypothetical protein